MAAENWQKVREVFDAVLRQEPEQRQNYLNEACGDDQDLLFEVESLVSSLAKSDEFLETPAVAHVADLIEPDTNRLAEGTRFGHYEITRHIGAGGMGDVYLAQDLKLDRHVAVKILNEEFSRDEANLERFVREAKAASALNHPNILVIHQIDESNGAHYIVSEFIEGTTLRKALTQSQMSLDEVLDVSIQVAGALSAAHGAHLIHRDIKPENVMVRFDGYVKVLDFGLAKLVEQEDNPFTGSAGPTGRRNETGKGMILGTINYMSPEQAKGERVDERTDIFSLGVVIHEMVAGQTPFGGDTMSQIVANLIHAEPPALSRFGSSVPDELQRIVFKTLHKNKDGRYQTVRGLLTDLKDLREALTSEGKLKKSDSPEAQATTILQTTTAGVNRQTAETQRGFSQQIKQHKSLATSALAVLLIGAVALGYYFFHARKAVAGGKNSIAVLPLNPINTATRDEIFEVGIADSLIQRFSSMKGLEVRPLSATRKYTDIAQDPIAAGKEQQVGYVLAANYQLAGGKIRITAQLFNVATEQIEETYKSEKDAGDVFAMQDAIAGEIGNKLLARFATSSSSLVAKRGTTNEQAYRLFLQAMYLYDRRDLADAQKAVEYLEQATQLDPKFARAWAGKAHVHRALGNFSGNTHEEYKKSIEAINRALELDENLADAHSALCENKYFYERDLHGAELECKRAIELDPNSALAHQIYSRNLMVLERFDDSIAEIKTAIDLEPTSLFSQRNFGIAYYYARRYPEAVAQFKRVTEMDPNFEATYPWLINTLKLEGNEPEAFAWFVKWQGVQKADEETLQAFKTAYQTSGWRGVGLERVKRFDESKIRTYFMEACMAAQADNKGKALEYLEKSYQRREWGMAYLRFEPALDVLRDDRRFDELVRRVGMK